MASGRRLLSLASAGKLPYAVRLKNRKITEFSSAKDIEAFVSSTPAGEFHASTVAKSFLALAQHGSTSTASAEKLAALAQRMVFADESELAQVCLAIAQLGLLDRVPLEMVKQLDKHHEQLASPSSISNTLCVLALDQPQKEEERMYSSLASRLLGQMEVMPHWDLFRTKQLVQVMWAMAVLQPSDRSQLVSRLVDEFCEYRDLSLLTVSELGNLAWAASTLKVKSSPLFELVGRELVHRRGQSDLVEYDPQCIVSLAWAFAWQSAAAPTGVLDKLCNEAMHHSNSFTSMQAATMLCALSEKSFRADKLLPVLTQQVLDNLGSATVEDLTFTLQTFAWFDVTKKGDALLTKLVSEVCRRPVDNRTVCTTLWCLAALDLLHEDNVREYFNQPPLPVQVDGTAKEAHQVFQTKLMWQQAFPKKPIPALLNSIASVDWIHSHVGKMDQGFTSIQLQALNCILEHFPDAVNNKVLLDGITCDMFIKSQNTAIFIDYPTRFCVNDSKLMTGKLRVKQRILERAGYKVLHLSAAAKFDRAAINEKHKLIKQLIKQLN